MPQEVKLVPGENAQLENKPFSKPISEPKNGKQEKLTKPQAGARVSQADKKHMPENVEADNWPITAIKIWVVFFALMLSFILSLFTVIVDLIFSPTVENFGLTNEIWNYTWNTILIDWCGRSSTATGVIVGVISLIIFCSIVFKEIFDAIYSSRRHVGDGSIAPSIIFTFYNDNAYN